MNYKIAEATDPFTATGMTGNISLNAGAQATGKIYACDYGG